MIKGHFDKSLIIEWEGFIAEGKEQKSCAAV